MRPPGTFRPARSAVALGLLALLGALSTGLPTHHHADAPGSVEGPVVVPADHHGHGTLLVEQDDRSPSTAPQVVAVPEGPIEAPPAPEVTAVIADADPVGPTEHPPPPGAPRAPPHSS